MADKILNTRIALKIDTLENWNKSTLPLKKGELAIATVAASAGTSLTEPVVMIKVGEDGVKTFSQLDWNLHAKASDVLAACKNETSLKAFVNGVIADAGIATSEAMEALAGRVTTAEGEIDTLQSEMDAVEKKAADNEAAIATLNGDASTAGSVAKAIADAIAALDLGNTYEAKGAAATAKSEVIGSSDDTADANTIYGAKKYADGLNSAVDTRVQALENAIGEGGTVGSQIDAKINALDVTDTAVAGQYVSSVSEVDGKVVVTRENLPDYTETYDAKGAAAQALTDAKSYADGLAGNYDSKGSAAQALTDAKAYTDTEVAKANTAASAAQAAADKAQGEVDALETLHAEDKAALAADIKKNTDAIAVLNGNSETEGSVDKKVADAINDFATKISDDQTVNTYKELIDYAAEHGAEFTELVGEVDANAKAIETLNGDATVAGSVDKKIADAIAAENLSQYATDSELSAVSGKVTTLEGKMTTAESDIDALETKVNALEVTGGQANVIETVKVNGVALTPDDKKAVDVIVPTGALASKDKVAEADLETALATKINAKAEQSDLDALSTRVGTIPEGSSAGNVIAYVDEKVAAEGVAALKGRVDTAEGDIDKLEAAVEKLSATSGEGSVAQALADAKAYTDELANGQVAANKTAIETLNGTGEGSVSKAVSDAIAGLDVEDAEVEHQVVTAVSETDGKIAVTRKQLTTDDIAAGAETWVFDCGGAGV